MATIIIDGRKTSLEIRAEVAARAALLKQETGIVPGLAVILIGDDPASHSYVKSKEKACRETGFYSVTDRLPASTQQQELIALVRKYNGDVRIHGILVQMPLPRHLDEQKVIETILPEKDVDGFHPVNVGKLMIGLDALVPCTPAGIIELLKRWSIQTSGKHVVVVGRSNIVGKPIAALLIQKQPWANAVVTVVHTGAPDISLYTKQADILIAAIGKPRAITADMVKPGCVVIDVGMNRIHDSTTPSGNRMVGDVDFDAVAPLTSAITPVPGGVGLMTIALLLQNTLKAAIESTKRS
ncbi:MAG: bifunctional 5,10-methylene-tetrahydrofolate dehydrogenase/5,10-methylene-tetrahydrofolate cyclohydrolase [Ignavibacteriales bacterium]|nr:bifunctional 5,10-methylene-tetrahydrofolate dehydrogenase/5,10-methylene-tetrahydrofolate cyclohydrolase [Ignavibacteriales bacterium]